MNYIYFILILINLKKMNFMRFDDLITYNKNFNNKQNANYSNNNNQTRAINFIYNSNNKLFQKERTPELEKDNSRINLTSLKKEIIYKLTSYTQEEQKVKFTNGIEEIYDDNKNDNLDNIDNKLFFNISNKKFSTPPRNTKSSYKKTKEHIKTPYRTTKSRSTKDKSKINKDNNKSNKSTKSSNYWKSLFFNDEMVENNISKEIDIDINRNCNSMILDNPYTIKKEYRLLFCNMSLDDNEEDLNKSF